MVGIDVAKDRLDVCVRPSGETFSTARTPAGLDALVARLTAAAPRLIVMEATGGFEVVVASALASAGLPAVVINPRQLRDFALATGQLAEPDRRDAAMIALFAERIRPPLRPLPDAQARDLGELLARRRQLVEMMTAERNRRQQVGSRHLPERLDAHLAWLQEELSVAEADLDGALRASTVWCQTAELLQSVPGVGTATVRTLSIELPELGSLVPSRSPRCAGSHRWPATADSSTRHPQAYSAEAAPACVPPFYMAAFGRGAVQTRALKAPLPAPSQQLARPTKSPSPPACASCSPPSTPSSAQVSHGNTPSTAQRRFDPSQPWAVPVAGSRPAAAKGGGAQRPALNRPPARPENHGSETTLDFQDSRWTIMSIGLRDWAHGF